MDIPNTHDGIVKFVRSNVDRLVQLNGGIYTLAEWKGKIVGYKISSGTNETLIVIEATEPANLAFPKTENAFIVTDRNLEKTKTIAVLPKRLIKFLNNNKEVKKEIKSHPHKCTARGCGADALILFQWVECTNPSCSFYKT
jgi:hypothetical protein